MDRKRWRTVPSLRLLPLCPQRRWHTVKQSFRIFNPNQSDSGASLLHLDSHFFRDVQVFCPPIIYLAPISSVLTTLEAFKMIPYFPPRSH